MVKPTVTKKDMEKAISIKLSPIGETRKDVTILITNYLGPISKKWNAITYYKNETPIKESLSVTKAQELINSNMETNDFLGLSYHVIFRKTLDSAFKIIKGNAGKRILIN